MYSFDSVIRYSETGENERLSVYGLVNYFQDCSLFQSMCLHAGVDELAVKHRSWILSYWQIDIKVLPRLADKVTVKTWAYDFQGFLGYRNFLMESADGDVLSAANSVWVYVDTENGKPVKADSAATEIYAPEPRYGGMEYEPRKIKLAGEFTPMEERVVRQCDIDTNHHMNNAEYVRIAADFLPQGIDIRRLRVEYKRAAMLGDTIMPMVNGTMPGCQVILADRDGKPYAVTEWI
jgi:acyl-ACP thioesterase